MFVIGVFRQYGAFVLPLSSGGTMSINDNLPSSSPSPKSTLIGLACVIAVVAIFVLYYRIVGF